MRIDRLDLMAYGSFTDRSLNFVNGDAGLHLIYGDNEAGKSTALRSLIAWLFGIPARTRDNYRHANPQLRIGGKLRLTNGRELEFVRRKGLKGTLLKPGSDEPLDDAALLPFLPGGIDEALFTRLYGIDHGRLIAGGQELLDQSGDLGQALFSAAVGTAGLRDVLSGLQNEAENLYKPRASTKLVNQAVANFKEAQKRIKESTLPVADWKRLQKALAEIQFEIDQVEAAIQSHSRAKSRLDRLNRVKGLLAERRAAMARLEDLQAVRLLPEDFDEKRKEALNRQQTAAQAREKAEAKLARLQKDAQALNVRTELLENEEAILAIYKELGAVEKTLRDRPQQDGKRRLLRNEAEILLKTARPDVALDDADPLRPLLNNKRRIASLANKHLLLHQKTKQAQTTLAGTADEQASIRKQLDAQPPSNLPTGELKAVIAAARKAGNLEARLVSSEKRAREEKAACEDELARLGRFSGTLEGLLSIPLPGFETMTRFGKQLDELAERMRDHKRRRQDCEEQQNQAEQALKALLLTSDAPTLAELETARRLRNKVWQGIKRRYIERSDKDKNAAGVMPGPESEADFGSASDPDSRSFTEPKLATIYEQKVETADHISDQLRTAADQVVKRADLEAMLENLRSRLSRIAEDIRSTDRATQDCIKAWQMVWQPLEVEAGTPQEMKEWVLRAEKLRSTVQSAKAVSAEAQELARECHTHKDAVSQQISRFDAAANFQDMRLEAMLHLCEQRVAQEEQALARRQQLAHALGEAEVRIKKTRDDLKSIEADQTSWQQEWAQAIEGLGLKADVHPELAAETLEQLVMFFDKYDKSEELRKRIYGMDQVAQQFETKVFAFADSIGFPKDGWDAKSIAAQLNRDLSAAREARASRQKIEIQLKEIKEDLANAAITLRMAGEQLAALREQAGVETDDALALAIEHSRKKREQQYELDGLEQALIRSGDGLSVEALAQEADASDMDAIEGELARVQTELGGLQEKRDDLRDQRKTLQNDISARDGRATAAGASEEAEQHLATIIAGAEQYLRLQIAALILEQRIEDYRKKNQAPVLSRAGRLFARLTLGSYTNLRDELGDDGKPVLLGVRSNDVEVSIGGMSDGTRDQLYLALRLATLEQHLSKGEPMPFIVDDILIGFDDNRTRVCLEILAELAATTQVLLFTHHRRVVELAAGLAAQMHELGGCKE